MSADRGQPPLPEGFGVVLDPATRRLGGGSVLLGGAPVRLLRLSRSGARHVERWAGGARPDSRPARLFARRLVDAGVAHPRPPAPDRRRDVTVVVPVRDRPEALRRCLAALGTAHRVIVVDDGSRDAAATARVARAAGARLLRRERPGGPGAARNTGLASCVTPYVAFVDSDCLPRPGWLEPLLEHFGDPLVAAAAPRVVPAEPDRDSWLGRYQATASSHDRGPRESHVAPGSRVSHVPGTALIVRRTAARTGFESAMRGEDVDLVRRLVERGWSVRYEPRAAVAHAHRVTVAGWLESRYRYGTSAGPLARRHPGTLIPAVIPPWGAAFWGLLLARRPAMAFGALGLATVLLARQLGYLAHPWTTAAWLSGQGSVVGGWRAATVLARRWWPATLVVAATSKEVRLVVCALALVPPLLEWQRERPAVDPVRYTMARLADDAAYATGVWWSSLRCRTAEPLLPTLAPRSLASKP